MSSASYFFSKLMLAMALASTVSVAPNALASTPVTAESSARLEALVVDSLKFIREQKFDEALAAINQAIDINPSFRLAQMIKGDLLLARTRPLDGGFGATSNAPANTIAGFQHEARVRLSRYEVPPPTDLIPDAFLKLSPEQKYAILVDTSKARIYLFENVNGKLQYERDYYAVIGKLGADKYKEGDKRTPLGVYHITRSIDTKTLPDMYGTGAYPINYPNPLDRKLKRTGYGIWLHGSPSNTYSRPPQDSDGCVAMTNPDMLDLGKNIQVGVTPVVITSNINWVKKSEHETLSNDLQKQIETWRKDWESKDASRYLKHYANKFWSDDGSTVEKWRDQKTRVNQGKAWIKVELNNLSILRYPTDQTIIEVKFEQNYQSNNFNEVSKKRQYWVKEGQDWKILYEGEA